MALYHIRIERYNGYLWEHNVRYTLKFIEKHILTYLNDIKKVELCRID